MNLDEKDIELLDQYVKGKLSGAELSDFEQRLASDITFAEQVAWHKKLVGGIKKKSRKELKDYLQMLEEQDISPHNTSARKSMVFPSNYWKYAVAAALALLIGTVFLFQQFTPSPQDLYAQYYQPYPNVEATIERNDETADAYTQAFQLYEDGQYEEASTAFERLLQADVPSEALNFYAGLTALELNRSEQALKYFDKVIGNPGHKFHQQSLWYAALTALKGRDIENAKKYLQQLSGEKGFYGEKAAQLLEEL